MNKYQELSKKYDNFVPSPNASTSASSAIPKKSKLEQRIINTRSKRINDHRGTVGDGL